MGQLATNKRIGTRTEVGEQRQVSQATQVALQAVVVQVDLAQLGHSVEIRKRARQVVQEHEEDLQARECGELRGDFAVEAVV